MICRSCGTEIADKAIVCYRCGAATATPTATRPARRPGRGGLLAGLAAAALLVAVAVLLGPRLPAGASSVLAGAGAALAALAILRLIARSRRT
jgi:hypothetical protein